MEGLDTQLGQIYIHSRKLSKSFILVESGKVPETGAELYTIVEVGKDEEKVAKILLASLKKNYRRANPNAFENAIAQANKQLATMVAEGSDAWVGKTNALLAVKQGDEVSVATCGKIHAYLYRARQLSDLSDSPKKQNPLKAIENFVVGKVQTGDFLIFSTGELFNYISAERVQSLIDAQPLAAACEAIASLIKDNAGEETAFGTMILELGGRAASPVKSEKASALAKVGALSSRVAAAWSSITSRSGSVRDQVREQAKGYAAGVADLKSLRALPRAKKFFLAAAAACVVLLAVNIAVAVHAANVSRVHARADQQLSAIQYELNGASSAFTYSDQVTATNLLNTAKSDLAKVAMAGLSQAEREKLSQLSAQATAMDNTIAHIHTANAQLLVSYSGGPVDTFVLANGTAYLVNKAGDLLVPYSIAAGNGQTASAITLAVPPITNVAAINGAIIFTDKNGALYQLQAGATSAVKEKAQLPPGSRGLAFYGSPTRIFTIDRATNQVVSSTFASSKPPVPYLKVAVSMSRALDLAIDGSVYVLNPTGIQKFVSGNERAFASPSFTLADPATVYTQPGLGELFILDTQNNGIAEVNSATGQMMNQYRPANLAHIKAFAVDATNTASPTIYALDGQSLYKLAQ